MEKMKKYIGFTKVALPYGWLGNMSAFPIEYCGQTWKTSEALFQALRFDDLEIKAKIQAQQSPMAAKMVAKPVAYKQVVQPKSEQDLKNMELCLNLKLDQHPELKKLLNETGDAILFEDVRARPHGNNLFWGAILTTDELIGENKLCEIWMRLRANL